MEQQTRKVGRPTALTPFVKSKIPDLIRMGLTDTKIAEIIGVSQSTVSYWKKRNKQFVIEYNLLKQEQNSTVEKSLYKRATGFGVTVNQKEQYYPPDVQAISLWLKNKTEEWKEGGEQTGTVNVVFSTPRPSHVIPEVGNGHINGEYAPVVKHERKP